MFWANAPLSLHYCLVVVKTHCRILDNTRWHKVNANILNIFQMFETHSRYLVASRNTQWIFLSWGCLWEAVPFATTIAIHQGINSCEAEKRTTRERIPRICYHVWRFSLLIHISLIYTYYYLYLRQNNYRVGPIGLTINHAIPNATAEFHAKTMTTTLVYLQIE